MNTAHLEVASNQFSQEYSARSHQKTPYFVKLSSRMKQPAEIFAPVMDQSRALGILPKALSGKEDIAELPPIYLTDLKESRYGAYLHRKRLLLLNQAVFDSYKSNGAVVLLAGESKKFGYRWFDVYPVNQNRAVDMDNKLQSFRVNPETQKVENTGWYGPELQAFFDYIYNKIKLEDPNELPEFISKRVGPRIRLGTYNDQEYEVPFRSSKSILPEDIIIKPKFDPENGYFWVEGYDVNDREKNKLLFSRRILYKDELSNDFKIVDWYGPKIQTLVDWIHSATPLSNLKPVEVLIDQSTKYNIVYLEGTNLSIKFDSGNFDKTKPVQLVPKEHGPYKWIEAYQSDTFISSYIVSTETGQPKLDYLPISIERQVLLDYVQGKVDATYLLDIPVHVSTKPQAHLASSGEILLSLALGAKDFTPGEKLTAKHVVRESGELILEILRENSDEVVKRFIFDRKIMNFRVILSKNSDPSEIVFSRQALSKPAGYWTRESTLEEARGFWTEHQEVSASKLITSSRGDLLKAIEKYLGGISNLRRILESEINTRSNNITLEQATSGLAALFMEGEN